MIANVEKDYRVFIEFSTWDGFVDILKAICFNGVVLVKIPVSCEMLEGKKLLEIQGVGVAGKRERKKVMVM